MVLFSTGAECRLVSVSQKNDYIRRCWYRRRLRGRCAANCMHLVVGLYEVVNDASFGLLSRSTSHRLFHAVRWRRYSGRKFEMSDRFYHFNLLLLVVTSSSVIM